MGKRGPTLSDSLRDKQPTETWLNMMSWAEGTRKCSSLPDTISEVEDWCVARNGDSARLILGEECPVLDQNASNSTLAPGDTISSALQGTRRVLGSLGGSDKGQWSAYHRLHAQIEQMQAKRTQSLLRYLQLDNVQNMRESFEDDYMFLPMDKNRGQTDMHFQTTVLLPKQTHLPGYRPVPDFA